MSEFRVDFKADTANVTKGIKDVQGGLKGISGIAKGVGASFATMMAPLLAVTAALGGIAFIANGLKGAIDFGGDMADLSSKTGIAVKDLVILTEAFKLAGMEGADLGKIVNGLSAKLDAPTPKILATMEMLGLSMKDIQKLPIGERFQVIGSAIGNLSSATERANASQALFGRTMGNNLLVLFNTKGAFEDAKKSVGRMAALLDKYAPAFETIGDALEKLPTKSLQFFVAAIAENANRLINLADWISKLDFTNAGKQLGGILNTIGDIVETLGEAKNLGDVFDTFSDAIELGWLNVKPILMDGMKEVATFFANAMIEAFKKSNSMFAGASTYAAAANAIATGVGIAAGTGAKDGKIDSGKGYTRSQEEENRLKTLQNRLTGDKPSEYVAVNVKEQIGKMHEAIAAYYAKIAKVTEDAIKSKFTAAQDFIGNFQAKSNEDPEKNEKGFKGLLDKFFKTDKLKNPITSLQSIGGASIFTGNPALSELQTQTNELRQIKELLSRTPSTNITQTTRATFGA